MSALEKMTRVIDIAAHAPAMRRMDLGRRKRIGPVLSKVFSSGKIDHKPGDTDVSTAQRAKLARFFA
jgi:hypothetical protein